MRVLGIDPSLSRTALALATDDAVPEYRHWTLQTRPDWPLPRRLRYLADGAFDVAAGCRPDLIVLEEPGFIRTGGGRGAEFGLPRAQGAIIAGLPPEIPLDIVTVARWRGRDGLGIRMPRGAGKAPLLAYVAARGIAVPPKRPAGDALDDDVAEAYCIALYGLRNVPPGDTLAAT